MNIRINKVVNSKASNGAKLLLWSGTNVPTCVDTKSIEILETPRLRFKKYWNRRIIKCYVLKSASIFFLPSFRERAA